MLLVNDVAVTSSCHQPEVTPVVPFKNKIQYYLFEHSIYVKRNVAYEYNTPII
jgi:hypothetical protein